MESSVLLIKTSSRGIKYITDLEGNVVQKECTKCNDMTPIEDFPTQKIGFAGTESVCKHCKKEAVKFNNLIKRLKNDIKSV